MSQSWIITPKMIRKIVPFDNLNGLKTSFDVRFQHRRSDILVMKTRRSILEEIWSWIWSWIWTWILDLDLHLDLHLDHQFLMENIDYSLKHTFFGGGQVTKKSWRVGASNKKKLTCLNVMLLKTCLFQPAPPSGTPHADHGYPFIWQSEPYMLGACLGKEAANCIAFVCKRPCTHTCCGRNFKTENLILGSDM